MRLFALDPGDVDLLGEGDGGIVVGDEAAGRGVGAGQGDAVVDVEDAGGAARRVDDAGSGDLVVLGVHLAIGPDAAAGDRGLSRRRGLRVLAEVVGAVEHGELEAAGVLRRGRKVSTAASCVVVLLG